MIKCPICNADTKIFSKKDGFLIYKCSECGFGFTENTNIQKAEYHRDDTYIEEEDLFKNIFKKREKIINSLMNPGKVLEVGCSTGLLLSLLKKSGWKVSGVELSKKAAEVANKKGIDVIIGTFEQFKTTEKYNLLIFNHVLEHLENPSEVLKKSRSLLKDEGYLFISLPNFDSFTALVSKSNWPLLLPEEHLWHFTNKSLRILLKKMGFKIVYTDRTSGIWDYGNPVLGLTNSLLSFKKRFFTELISALPSLVLTKLDLGSGLTIVAKKN